MFAKNELNTKRAAVMVASLEREKAGYEARVAAVKDGHEDPRTVAQLEDRIKQVDASIKRYKAGAKTKTEDDAS